MSRSGPVEPMGRDPQPLPQGEPPSKILERGRLAAAPPPDTRRLQVLYAVIETLVGNLRLEEILPSVLGTLRDLFAYDRCAVAGRTPDGKLVTWASHPPGATPLSRSVADRVLETAEALLCDDVQEQAPFSLSESIIGLHIRSVLCAPLVSRGQVRGVIYLDRSVAAAYTLEDLALLHTVSHLVAIALENARLYADLQGRFEQSAERLRQVKGRLIETERVAALGRLTQALAHEVRNPVAVIGGMSRRLLKACADPAVEHDAFAIVQEAERLERAVRRVEEVIALPVAAFRLAPLEDTVTAVFGELTPVLAARGVESAVSYRLGNRSIPHDPALTGAALRAVAEKAAAASAPGATLRVALEEAPGGWALRVGTAGPEDDAGERRDFFDPFFRTHPWADDLGLTLAAVALARQGGALHLGTEPDRGPDFALLLSASAPQEVG